MTYEINIKLKVESPLTEEQVRGMYVDLVAGHDDQNHKTISQNVEIVNGVPKKSKRNILLIFVPK